MIKRTYMSALLGAILLAGVTACGSDGGSAESGSEGGGPEVSIVSPEDGGSISAPFDLEVDASEDLGTTESGKHHVHLYFDGDDSKYEVIEGKTWKVKEDSPALAGLTPGEHTMNVSLRNADHSPAGAETEIKVTVGGAGDAPSDDSSGGGNSGGYDY